MTIKFNHKIQDLVESTDTKGQGEVDWMHETSTFMCIYALIIFTELPPESATFCPEVCVSLFSGKGLTFILRNEKLVFSACPNPTS